MEGTPPCKLEFVSVGCNSGANCLDWGRNNLVAYGGCNFVALYHPESFQTVATLCGHTGRVNSAKWIPNLQYGIENRWEQEEVELISASTDKTLIAWRKEQDKWVQTAQLKGHTEAVTSVSVVDLSDGTLYAASTSVDATLRVWMRSASSANAAVRNDAWVCVQTINRAPKMFQSVSIARIPSSSSSSRESVIIAAAGVDSSIHLYAQQDQTTTSDSQQLPFKPLVVLEGHQDWIRCLSFATTDDNTLLLASSSQDNRVRLWSVGPLKDSEIGNLLQGVDSNSSRISSKGHVVDINSQKYVVLLDAVLSVHEQWVYSIAWQRRVRVGDKVTQPMRLLSASMDRTMIVWEPAGDGSGIWLDQARVGEMGGNTLGFFGCAFSPSGDSILAHGYNGAFHLWKQVKEKIGGEDGGAGIEDITWQPVVTVSGHFAGVEDLSWDTTGSYFVTVSEDKTARAFSQWSASTQLAKFPGNIPAHTTWHEIARPLIHGYELTTLAFVQGLRHRIVAGAEEKPLRVFDAPQTFVDSLEAISGQSLGADVSGVDRPLAASQPALGLSNKPYFAGGAGPSDDINVPMSMGEDEGGPLDLEQQRPFNPSAHSSPPFEEDLLQATLYPEIMKLYGHGNEVVAVACSNDGDVIASSCKGTTPETSSIRLWSTKTWESLGVVQAHTLTVTQMVFSHDDKYLLTVSRDRQFCILERKANEAAEGPAYRVISTKAKAHARILWGCDWSHDDAVYATAARDQTVKVWSGTSAPKLIATIETQSPATAVAFAPRACANAGDASAGVQYVLAIGEEGGRIALWTGFADAGRKWTQYAEIPAHLGHVSVVRRLRWRINAEEDRKKRDDKEKEKAIENDTKQLLLASCSSDWSVRLFSLSIP